MKKLTIIFATALIISACNVGNEDSGELNVDSIKVSDTPFTPIGVDTTNHLTTDTIIQ